MRVSDFMGKLVEVIKSSRVAIGTLRHKGVGYRGERRMAAKLAYRAAKRSAKAMP